MRSLRAPILVTVLAIGRCVACTIVYPTYDVGPDFQVRVESDGRPAVGVRVDLGPYHALTDKGGIAVFRRIPEGAFSVGIDHDAGIPDRPGVKVKRNGPANATIPLRWPSLKAVSARKLRGRLRFSYPDSEAIALELLEGISGRVLASQRTSGHGEFEFRGFGPGLYFLRLREYPGGGLIALSLDPSATSDQMDIAFGFTSLRIRIRRPRQVPSNGARRCRIARQSRRPPRSRDSAS